MSKTEKACVGNNIVKNARTIDETIHFLFPKNFRDQTTPTTY